MNCSHSLKHYVWNLKEPRENGDWWNNFEFCQQIARVILCEYSMEKAWKLTLLCLPTTIFKYSCHWEEE